MMNSGSSASLTTRMMGAARLDTATYEDVERDTTATGQAATVVVIVAIASAIGNGIAAAMAGESTGIVGGVIGGLVSSLIGWLVWAYVTYFVGTRLFNGTATPGEMLRTIGFAQAPGVLNILAFIPVLGALIRVVVAIWLLVAGVIAVRQALDFDTGKAILTTFIGWLALVVITVAVAAVLASLGMGAAMMFGG